MRHIIRHNRFLLAFWRGVHLCLHARVCECVCQPMTDLSSEPCFPKQPTERTPGDGDSLQLRKHIPAGTLRGHKSTLNLSAHGSRWTHTKVCFPPGH